MNRSKYFDFIESKLSLLATRIEMRGGLNILNLHLHSENFYLHFFKVLFGWVLQNLNAVRQNVAGIDLVDTTTIRSSSRFLPQQLSRRLNQPSLKTFPPTRAIPLNLYPSPKMQMIYEPKHLWILIIWHLSPPRIFLISPLFYRLLIRWT